MFGFVFDRNNIREYRSNIFLTICYLCGFFYRVGIEVPTIEVRYERLTVEAEAYVGGRALPTLLNSVTNAVEVNLFNQILLYQLLLFLCFLITSGLFRAIAALGRNMIVANTFGSFALLTLLTLGGFIMSRSEFK